MEIEGSFGSVGNDTIATPMVRRITAVHRLPLRGRPRRRTVKTAVVSI
jgi:hypothetical protein